MKIKIELFGISREFSKNNLIEFEINNNSTIKDIRLKMIDEFNNGLYVKSGKKYDKVITKGSVWGFIAKEDGLLKGIPHKKGDVFKAAGWRAPAKHVRGSIFSDSTDWYTWTGPNYMI